MIGQAIASLGAWTWVAVGALLLIGEIVIPGTFLLWLGLAAFATGAIFLLVPAAWPIQIGVFAALAVASVVGWFRFARRHGDTASEQPDLNRRIETIVGREFVLEAPMVAGRGRVRIADTVWAATGPDCPSGVKVRVTRVDGATLVVEPI